MNVAPDILADQYQRARRLWPVIAVVEAEFDLPACLLYAVGSKETNLRQEYAEGQVHRDGHGWGLFGADDRWNTLDLPHFASDPEEQARLAARTLRANFRRLGNWLDAVNAYGPAAGRPAYGADVLERATFLAGEGGAVVIGWMPNVLHTPPNSRQGLAWVEGTAWKLLLHTTESNYRRSQGGRVNYHGHQSYPHFEVSEDAIEQYLPITVGAYALAASTDKYGYGNAAHPVQIEIVWNAANARNMPERLLANIAKVLTFLRRQTKMRPNLPPQGFPERISQSYWFTKQGWYDFEGLAGHGNVPGNFDRWDPGPLPVERIVALSNAEMGAPVPSPEEDDMALPLFGDGPENRGGGLWMASGPFRKRVHTTEVWSDYERLGARHVGVFGVAMFDALIDIEAALAARIVVTPGEAGDIDTKAIAKAVADEMYGRLAS